MFAFAQSESSYSESSEDCSSEGTNPEQENNTENNPQAATPKSNTGLNGNTGASGNQGASSTNTETQGANASSFPGCLSSTCDIVVDSTCGGGGESGEIIKSASGGGSGFSAESTLNSSGYQSQESGAFPSFASSFCSNGSGVGTSDMHSVASPHKAEAETTYMEHMSTTPAASFKLEPISEILNPLRFPGYAGTGLESWSPLTSSTQPTSCDQNVTTSVSSMTSSSLPQYAQQPAESFHVTSASAHQQSLAATGGVSSTSPTSHNVAGYECQNVASNQSMGYANTSMTYASVEKSVTEPVGHVDSQDNATMETSTKVYQDLTVSSAMQQNSCLSLPAVHHETALASHQQNTNGDVVTPYDNLQQPSYKMSAPSTIGVADVATSGGAIHATSLVDNVISTSSSPDRVDVCDTSSTSSNKSSEAETASTTDDSEDSGLGSDDQHPSNGGGVTKATTTTTPLLMETTSNDVAVDATASQPQQQAVSSSSASAAESFVGIMKESIVGVSA